MEIQENEYVRTDNREIFKVLEVEKGSVKIKSDYREWIGICCIQNHSFNIIDLIEVGDIVDIKTGLYSGFMYFVENEDDLMLLKEQIKKFWVIKSIVTKEQFESIKYEV